MRPVKLLKRQSYGRATSTCYDGAFSSQHNPRDVRENRRLEVKLQIDDAVYSSSQRADRHEAAVRGDCRARDIARAFGRKE